MESNLDSAPSTPDSIVSRIVDTEFLTDDNRYFQEEAKMPSSGGAVRQTWRSMPLPHLYHCHVSSPFGTYDHLHVVYAI
jgi:hypothetical protein